MGKTAPERPDNAFEKIVGDPGARQFEFINPGLFYTLLSKATTFGKARNQKHWQYFKGKNINIERVKDITKCKYRKL